MMEKIQRLSESLPESLFMGLGSALLVAVLGWLVSVIVGFRHRWMRAGLIIPITNPFLVLVMAFKPWGAAKWPLLLYFLSIVVLAIGGHVSATVEKRALAAERQRYADAGEPFTPEEIRPLRDRPESPELNVWEHPYLRVLADAGQSNEAGRRALDRMDTEYQPLVLPDLTGDLTYAPSADSDDLSRFPGGASGGGLRGLHRAALACIQSTGGTIDPASAPESWREIGETVAAYFAAREDDLTGLREAVRRPVDAYPLAWNEGFKMLFPHLPYLKWFTSSVSTLTKAQAASGKSAEAFENARLAAALSGTGEADLLIFHLVQMAQCTIALDAIQTVQAFHPWTPDQWRTLKSDFDSLDLIAATPAAIRGERVFGEACMRPILNGSARELNEHFRTLGTFEITREFESTDPWWVVPNLLLSGYAQGITAQQWRMALGGYQHLIESIESAVERSRITPWMECVLEPDPSLYWEYGVFAESLFPMMERSFERAVVIQARLRLFEAACVLEHYFLEHRMYPETLEALVPFFAGTVPVDPMNGQPFVYERHGESGFRLRSVGQNGVDDGAAVSGGETPADAEPSDDLVWWVHGDLPAVPEFTWTAESDSGDLLDEELMRRYGLQPE